MDDEVSIAITASGGTVLRHETQLQGAKTAEGCVEVEEGSVEAEKRLRLLL